MIDDLLNDIEGNYDKALAFLKNKYGNTKAFLLKRLGRKTATDLRAMKAHLTGIKIKENRDNPKPKLKEVSVNPKLEPWQTVKKDFIPPIDDEITNNLWRKYSIENNKRRRKKNELIDYSVTDEMRCKLIDEIEEHLRTEREIFKQLIHYYNHREVLEPKKKKKTPISEITDVEKLNKKANNIYRQLSYNRDRLKKSTLSAEQKKYNKKIAQLESELQEINDRKIILNNGFNAT